jgi:hypothetical protein
MQGNAVDRTITQDTRPYSTSPLPHHNTLLSVKFLPTQRGPQKSNKKPHHNGAGPRNTQTAWEKSGGPYAKGGTSCAPIVPEVVVHVK